MSGYVMSLRGKKLCHHSGDQVVSLAIQLTKCSAVQVDYSGVSRVSELDDFEVCSPEGTSLFCRHMFSSTEWQIIDLHLQLWGADRH